MCMPNSAVSSLSDGTLLRTTQTSFDVRLETDVIALLRTIHVNTIETDLKNHLRDLIFAYRQSMNSVDLAQVVNVFKELGIIIVADTVVPAKETAINTLLPKKQSSISTSRPQPRFVPVIPKPIVTSVPVQVLEPIGVPSYNEEVVVPITVPEPVAQPIQVMPVVEKIAEPVVETPIQKVEVVIPVATPTPTPTPVPPLPSVTYASPADRIKEIKHQVNEKVGNPINLIDAHNEVGREYMNALLDAMKKSNGGQPQEVSEAMARLETAFIGVLTALKGGDRVPSTSVQPAVSTPSYVVSQPEVQSVPQSKDQELKTEVTSVNPVKIKIVQEETVDSPEVVAPSRVVPIVEEVSKASSPAAPLFSSVAQNLASIQVQSTRVRQTTPPHIPVAQATNPSFHSVAEDKTLQDSIRVQREDIKNQLQKEEAIKVAHMDPLQTPEVNSGLGQLLSEWSLFKSSGIFGTGPSGKDHVLYLKLAPLTMSAVIAGRFEGVTPKIKQSIADYMNGWRYEEGVAHEHGETFEHYLRRVIYHILNKQKQAG